MGARRESVMDWLVLGLMMRILMGAIVVACGVCGGRGGDVRDVGGRKEWEWDIEVGAIGRGRYRWWELFDISYRICNGDKVPNILSSGLPRPKPL